MPYSQPEDPWVIEALRRLGVLFERLPLDRGISQRTLSARSGVDQAMISRLKHGLAGGMRAQAIARLLRALQDYPNFLR